MASFPNKVFSEAVRVKNTTEDYEQLAVAIMPCGTTISARGRGSKGAVKSRTNGVCDQSIRRHLKKCKQCPEDFKKKYG